MSVADPYEGQPAPEPPIPGAPGTPDGSEHRQSPPPDALAVDPNAIIHDPDNPVVFIGEAQAGRVLTGIDVAVDTARRILVGSWGRVVVILDENLQVHFAEAVDADANGPAIALKAVDELTRPRVGEDYSGGPLTPYSVTSSSGAFDVWTRVNAED